MNQGNVSRDTSRPQRQEWAGDRIRLRINGDMRDALQDYAQQHGLTTGQAVYRLLMEWRAGR